jgi:RNA polymerase sigma factor (sigma-70 family)
MNAREMELALVDKIINGEDVLINIERLFMSLRPLFNSVIHKYGRKNEREDLMQEMYMALLKTIEVYKANRDDENYHFISLVYGNAKYHILGYLQKYYKRYLSKSGKVVIPDTPFDAVSLNEKVALEREVLEFQDVLPAETDIEAEFLENETEGERQRAKRILWEEVDKLGPLQRDTIVDFYVNGIPHVEKAKSEGIPVSTVRTRMHYSLKRLRENTNVQDAAVAYLPSIAFCGNFGFFKAMQMSSTELVALRNLERAERGAKSTYRLIDQTFLNGKGNKALSRCTGVGVDAIRNLKEGTGGVIRATGERIVRFYGVPFNEVFEILDEKPGKKKPQLKTYYRANSDFFYSFSRAIINREKMNELNLSLSMVEHSILLLNRGGKVTPEKARKLALLFGETFEKLFKPDTDGRKSVKDKNDSGFLKK